MPIRNLVKIFIKILDFSISFIFNLKDYEREIYYYRREKFIMLEMDKTFYCYIFKEG